MGQFSLDVTATDTDALVVPRGELDMAAAPELLRTLDGLIDRHVVLDLRAAEFIDSSGFAAIVRAHRRHGERLSILRPTGKAARALEVTGLDGLVPFVDG